MTFDETIRLPSPLEEIRLNGDVVLQPNELEPVARALFDVDIRWAPDNEFANELCITVPALIELLKPSIQQPRSGELAVALLTISGTRRFTRQLGMKRKATSETSSR